MLTGLVHTLRDRLLIRQRELSMVLDQDILIAPGSSIPIRQEMTALKGDLDKCVAALQSQKNCNSGNYHDARFQHQLDGGQRRYKCMNDLKIRVFSGLHLLGKNMERGEELLVFCEKHLAHELTKPEPIPVEWSDDEKHVQDDIPLTHTEKLLVRPSRNYIVKEIDAEWNTEVDLNVRRKRKVRADGGHFNDMDGRFHPDERAEEVLRKEHAKRTQDRRKCEYFHSRKGCRKGFSCTQFHDLGASENDEDYTYRNFSSSAASSSHAKYRRR